jgi:hypothetical protein
LDAEVLVVYLCLGSYGVGVAPAPLLSSDYDMGRINLFISCQQEAMEFIDNVSGRHLLSTKNARIN